MPAALPRSIAPDQGSVPPARGGRNARRARSRRRLAGAVAAALSCAVLALAGCSPDEPAERAGGGVGARDTTTSTAAGAADGTPGPEAEPSAGCGSEPPVAATDDPVGDVPLELDVDGTTRRYRLGVPAAYDPDVPAPVVLNLHGALSNAHEQSVYSGLPARGTDRGYLVVAPDAIDELWELPAVGRDDVFLTTLLDELAADYCVDLRRVHAAGISLGAWKATATACEHQDRFASLVLVAEQVAPPGCALPVLAFHGTADTIVPYGAGADPGVVVTGANAGLPGVEVNMPAWAANNGCATEHDVEHLPPDVDRWVFRDCPEGVDVELYSIRGGGHTWPGATIEFPGTTQTVDATDLALDWFDAHPRRG